ncbi:lytic transglycosylase domain-containing protein [Hydrogenophaga luteola]
MAPVYANTYLKVDEKGMEHWSSHPTDPGFDITMIEPSPKEPAQEMASSGGVWLESAVRTQARSLRPLIRQMGLRYGVDAAWISALIEVESGFNARAVSPKGARGLMQIMPATASRYGVRNVRDLLNPERNLDVGVRHLRELLDAHDNNWVLALSAYNAGQGAVARKGNRIPNYRETMLYVPSILARVEQHRSWLNQLD